jgi:hypothetical protein
LGPLASPCSDSGDTGLGGPDDVRVRPSIPREFSKTRLRFNQ